MRYYIYTRASTQEQQKKGNSHPYQIQGILSNPQLHKAEHLGTYSDTITGTKFDRPQLNILYQLCKSQPGHVDYIYIYKWDRFGRNLGEAVEMMKKFSKIGVEVNCLESKMDSEDDNFPVIQGVLLGMAESESRKISRRTRDGLYQANSQGYFTGSPPVGYERVRTNERHSSGNIRTIMKPLPKVGKIITKILETYAEGNVRKSELFQKYGEKINCKRSKFYRMFDNIFYAGYIELPNYKNFPAKRIRGKHQALISLKTFNRIQEIDSQHPNRGKKYNVESRGLYLHGILVKDKNFYTSYFSKGKNKRYGYYENKAEKGSILNASRTHSVVDEVMNQLSLELTSEHIQIAEEVIRSKMENYREELKNMKSNLRKIISDMEKLDEDYMSGVLPAKQYTKLTNFKEKAKEDMELSIGDFESKIVLQDHSVKEFSNTLKNLHEYYLKSNDSQRLEILRALFPDGFFVTKPEYQFRTPCINSVICLLCSNSAFYDAIKTKNGTPFSRNPVLGERWDTFRTHLMLLSNIKTA